MPALTDGKVDLIAAQLTVTPERQKLVDFSNPTRTDVSRRSWSRAQARRRVASPGGPVRQRGVRPRLQQLPCRACRPSTSSLKSRWQGPGCHQAGPGEPRRRRHPRDGERGPGAGHGRRRLSGATSGSRCSPTSTLHPAACAAHRRRRSRWPSGRTTRSSRRPLNALACGNTAMRYRLRQRPAASDTSRSTKYVKNAAAEAGTASKFTRGGRSLPQVRRAVSGRLPDLMAAQGYQESRLDQNAKSHGRRHRRDAGDARDRQGAEGRRHHAGRAEHPRRRQVHARS